MTILLGIAIFIIVNLSITVVLRYINENDGWLEYYRNHLTKVDASSIIESVE